MTVQEIIERLGEVQNIEQEILREFDATEVHVQSYDDMGFTMEFHGFTDLTTAFEKTQHVVSRFSKYRDDVKINLNISSTGPYDPHSEEEDNRPMSSVQVSFKSEESK